MFEVNAYPAILEKTPDGYSVFFPDLPGAVSAGQNYEDAIKQAKDCLSLHLYGMLQDHDPLPEPSHMDAIMNTLETDEVAALIDPDIFAIKAQQEDKTIRINISLPQSILAVIDSKARALHLRRSVFIQRLVREFV